jgi:hypothetical protein
MDRLNSLFVRWCGMRRRATMSLVLVVAASAGCDSGGVTRVAVEGRVTLDGKLLERGSIELIPTEGTTGPAAATTIENGEFSIGEGDGPVIGTLRVEIHSIEQPPFALDDPLEFSKHPPSLVAKDRIPARYNRDSTLTVTTTESGPNKFDFALSNDP